ncbi:MAG: molecular chaperone DnaJ [Candidatus Izemoplasmatales bacterium]|jgi:molecular chaperone DnaJ
MDKRDYYEVLGINRSATEDDIKKAYRSLAKKYHPDVSTEKNAEAKFKEVQEAYEVLSDSGKRTQYDQFGHAAFDQTRGQGFQGAGFEGFDFGDIFSAFFGGGARGQTQANRARPRKGADIQRRMTISFEESIFGKRETLKVPAYDECPSCHGTGAKSPSDIKICSKCRGTGEVTVESQTLFGRTQTRTTCPNCRGTGKEIINKCPTCGGDGRIKVNKDVEIRVPEGIETGQQIRIEGFGNKGMFGGPNGDLYIVFDVTPSDIFTREGDDIVITMPISFSQAALGAEIEVPTVYGKVLLKIPAGTQSNAKFRIREKGATNVRSKVKGDQHVIISVITPQRLSYEQKKLFEELAKVEDATANKSAWERFKANFIKSKKPSA